jgi:hypothetical protein
MNCVECGAMVAAAHGDGKLLIRCWHPDAGAHRRHAVTSPVPLKHKHTPIESPAWCPLEPKHAEPARDPKSMTFLDWCREAEMALISGEAADPHGSRREYLRIMLRKTRRTATEEERREGMEILERAAAIAGANQ